LPEPKAAPDPQAHLFKEAEPVNYEKVPDVPQITMSEPPSLGELVEQQVADHAAADLAAYLEMGDSLLKRIDAAVEDTERKLLEERREAILRRMTTLKKEGERMAKKDARIRSPEMRERALKDIRAGMSSRKVAEKHKISTGTVWIWKNADQAAQAATKAAEKTAGGGARPGRFTTAYPDEKRHAVLADVEAGMRVMEAAEKHGVHPSTIHYWKKGGGGHKPGPKPGFKAKAEPVAEVPAKPEAPKPSLTKAQEENRRLRTALAKLLAQEPTSGDVVALAEDNRRLRLIIDMWLGLS
jgi:transposase-like protein